MSASRESPASLGYPHRHLLGIEGLSAGEIEFLLDLSESYVAFNRADENRRHLLAGKTLINLFFENSTRTLTSFELAGKRLGADVINMAVGSSSVRKGETLIDTAMTLTAMHPDLLVVRHDQSGAVKLLSEKVNCAVINGGDAKMKELVTTVPDPDPAKKGQNLSYSPRQYVQTRPGLGALPPPEGKASPLPVAP